MNSSPLLSPAKAHPSICFSSEGDDTLFLETLATFNYGNLSEATLQALWKCAFEHFDAVIKIFPKFPLKFGPDSRDDRIDIRHQRTSYYNVTLTKVEWDAKIPEPLAEMFLALQSHQTSPDEVVAWNAFMNAMIRAQRADLIEKARGAF